VHDTTAEQIASPPDADGRAPASGLSTGGGRWAAAVLAGAASGLPLGWLLSYGALLPFYLGLFFFVLFGLMIGALMYRLGAPARPIARRRIRLGTVLVVGFTWAVSITVEATDFPDQMATKAIEGWRKLPAGTTADDFRRESAADVARHLNDNYAPGGVLGYLRWSATSSRLDRGVGKLRKPYQASQPRAWWVVRVVLSIGLLGFGIYSQVGPLTRLAVAKDRSGSAVNPLSKI